MGWLWSSSTPSGDTISARARPKSDPTPEPTTSSSPSPSTPLTREESAEKELQSILAEFQADLKPSSTRYNRVPKNPPPSQLQSHSPSSSENEPLSEQLLPTTMSCRNAFDAAFYCNSLGGQFNNLYRYGTVRACSENWNDFWFCMRTRTYPAAQKEAAVRAHYREKEKMRYERREGEEGVPKSSEDVWRSREKMLEWGEAFCEKEELLEEGDEAWNRRERERRARANS